MLKLLCGLEVFWDVSISMMLMLLTKIYRSAKLHFAQCLSTRSTPVQINVPRCRPMFCVTDVWILYIHFAIFQLFSARSSDMWVRACVFSCKGEVEGLHF